MDDKIKKIKRIRIISIAFLVVLFIMMPYFVFIVVSHNDDILKNFFAFTETTPKEVLETFTTSNLPNRFLIFGLPYIALGTLAGAIISTVFYIYYQKRTINFNNRMLLIGTITITSFIFITCLLFSFAEYYYDLFTEWCRSLKGGYTGPDYIENINNMIKPGAPNRDAIIEVLINLATGSGTQNPYPLAWIGINVIWWITGLQMIFIIFIMLKVGFKLEWLLNTNVNLNKKEELVVLKDTFNQSVAKKIISLFLIPNEFNISLWVIFFSSIAFIPQLIYTITIGSSFTDANRFILYSYLYSELTINVIIPGTSSILDQPNLDYFNMTSKMPGSPFFISIAPIIFSSLIISMLFAFSFVMIKKPNLTQKGFISFYFSFLIVTGTSLVMFLISQYQITQAVNYWNSQNDHFKETVMKPLFGTTKLNYFWLQGSELIASGILLSSFIGVLSIIAISHISKIKSNNNHEEQVRVRVNSKNL
ncbi:MULTISPECIES: polypeptide chain release factor methylase [Spiroplasma]|uniref:polypeptide chain release factor methylase n=1 Tax=Spiroplasma TaxID=2132 RepID=UPI0018DC08C9|nr:MULTISPECIES: polypeptide chain release factor methylase [Spiroplasma]MBH8622773.1 polypeptide chain release factor methylase [Spiroplasma sp. hyd1]UNF61165.1 polypeptide chain release factor methylase [Spiroplasma poulsonii]